MTVFKTFCTNLNDILEDQFAGPVVDVEKNKLSHTQSGLKSITATIALTERLQNI